MSGCAPKYLFSQFIKRTEVSNRRARNSQKLNIPVFKTGSGQRTFYYRTLSLRDALDASLKLCKNVKPFKQSIRSKLLQELYERPYFFNFEHVISTINNVVFRGRFVSFYC